MSDSQNSSTGMQERQNSISINSEKTSIKRSARISSNGQKTAAENGGDSEDLDQPNVKRMKPTKYVASDGRRCAEDVASDDPQAIIENEVADGTNTTARGPKLFPPESLNIVLQVSAGCRIGPNFNEAKIQGLSPYDPLPYPEMYTRVVQDLIRCAVRPEEVVAAIKVSAPREASTIITFFDRFKKKFACKNIPVVEDVNSAQSWLSDLLESLGCCKKLFLPDFLADEFVCKQCFEFNQGQRRGKAVSRDQAASVRHIQADDVIEIEDDDEDVMILEAEDEEKRKRIEEEQRKVAEEEKQKRREVERLKEMLIEEEEKNEAEKKRSEEEELMKIEEERRKAEEKRLLEKPILSKSIPSQGEVDVVKPDPDDDRYSLPPFSEICVFETGPFTPVKEYFSDEFSDDVSEGSHAPNAPKRNYSNLRLFSSTPLQSATIPAAFDHLEFGENEASERKREGERNADEEGCTARPTFISCVANSHLASADSLPVFQKKPRLPEGQNTTEEEKKAEEEDRRKKELMEEEAKENTIRAQKERERLEWKRRFKKEERLYDKIIEKITHPRAEHLEEIYNNINSIFLVLFKIPEERTELRPDLKNTVTSGSPDVTFTHDVRVNIYNDGGKEMWQLGDEEALDSNFLKTVSRHSCTGHHPLLFTSGPMLEMWLSLLIHCPKCVTVVSLSMALEKLRDFMRKEEIRKETEHREEEERRRQKEKEERMAEEDRIRREEKERLRKLKEEKKKKKAEQKMKEKEKKDRAEKERLEREMQERDEVEKKPVITAPSSEGRTRPTLAKERYNNIMAFFLYLFKLPKGRTELRPDLGNPVVSNSPGLSFKHMVRSRSFFVGQKEMWQIGDEEPMDSSVLKAIVTHICPTGLYSLNTEGTLLELWDSLLLHCPECINERSLKDALDKVREFIEAERSRR